MNEKIYDALKNAAVQHGRPLTYSDIAPLAELDMGRADHRNQIAKILDEISTEEHANGRPLLSAIVVHSEDYLPGGGFFKMAKRLGAFNKGSQSDFHAEELTNVYAYWRGKK
jgi:hypothetical protein